MSDDVAPFFRAFAWWVLVKCWGTLRHSDHLGWEPARATLDQRALTVKLTRTKTTGVGKEVPFRPVYVERTAFVLDGRWLETGYNLITSFWAFSRD